MNPLFSAAVVVCGLLVADIPAARAGTCSSPDERLDCSRSCESLNACLHCCTSIGGSASSCKAECVVLPAVSVRRPPRLTRPLRPPRPPRSLPTAPPIDAGRFSANCQLEAIPGGVIVHLQVTNGTGGDLWNVIAQQPFVQVEARTKFFLGKVPIPRSYEVLTAGGSVTFQWQGRMSSAGAVGISASASAVAASGESIDTPRVDCGAIDAEPPPSPPSPTPTMTIPHSEAVRCGGCHDGPHMAFVANKWLESQHAAYSVVASSISCAGCHSPLEASASTGTSSAATITEAQWQGVTCSACHPPEAQREASRSPIAKYDFRTQKYEPVPLWDADELCKNCHTGSHAQTFQGYGLVMHEAGVRCIDCHMAKIPGDDPSIGRRAAHDFKVTANLPYSCGTYPGGCHMRRPESWARRILELAPMHP